MPDFSLENQARGIVVGIDEVGRGPWAGPVVACAFAFHDRVALENYLPLISDSKKISAKRRELLFDAFHKVRGKACSFALAEASVQEIDQLNIRAATLLAMQRAYKKLELQADLVIVDGNALPCLPVPAIPVIKGDQTSYSIAAASILAKVSRDQLMAELALHHPYYAWEKNAGYGTKAHQDGLALHGVTIHHRRSFVPIQKIVGQIRENS